MVLLVVLAVGHLAVVTPPGGEAGAEEALETVGLHPQWPGATERDLCTALSCSHTRVGEPPTTRTAGLNSS